ncbi:hypothetical protein [Streptomyces sp. NPDC029526]|uniref:hypothetical protein n=1 Tax=Streptomyces sp. NPDC029526 TaxID=3155728 RepID=UPI0033E67BF5
MTHVEQARLVELALGHPADGNESALRHLAECDRCREELRSMTRVVAAARAADVVDLPTAPPERVWLRIMRDLDDTPGGPPPTGPSPGDGGPPARDPVPVRGPVPVRARAGGSDGRGRTRRVAWGAVLGAVCALVGVATRRAAVRRRAEAAAMRGGGRTGGPR